MAENLKNQGAVEGSYNTAIIRLKKRVKKRPIYQTNEFDNNNERIRRTGRVPKSEFDEIQEKAASTATSSNV